MGNTRRPADTEKLRLISAQECEQLKSYTQAAMLAAGGAANFALLCGVDAAQLSKYQGQAYPDFMRIDILVELTRHKGPYLLDKLCRMANGRFVPGEDAVEDVDPVDYADVATTAKESGDVITVLLEGLKDGRFDALEKRVSLEAIAELIDLLHELSRKLTTSPGLSLVGGR